MRTVMRRLRRWRLSIVSLLVFGTLCASMIVTVRRQTPRGLSVPPDTVARDELIAARDEAVTRSTHFEQLLVALGSFELGIVAYVAGVVLGKEANIQSPRLFFGLFAFLTFVTTITYLHTFRIYCAYSLYTAQLELGLGRGTRVMSEVFRLASAANVPSPMRDLLTTVAGSIEIIAFYPVFILCAAVTAFARRLKIDGDVVLSVVIISIGWTFLYSYPLLSEFMRLAEKAAGF